MFKKTPPYQLIGWGGSILMVILVGFFYQFQDGRVSSFWMGLMSAISFAVLLMAAMEIWILVTDYQKGHLFPMRNATFFLTGLTVISLPVLGIYAAVTGQALEPSTLLLLPVFLFMLVRNLFRIKIDSVALEAKTGFRSPTYVPLFNVANVEETEGGINIRTTEGKEIRLLRAFFFPRVWKKLRERLMQVGNPSL
ncbi:hypothetical protein [Neolewinella persica]|uniref:hypothetical protein n=1 Tax=Neolewinella persica TaxID=70998 RepID=UPI0003630CCC|nr:hypothetical protein [Neolewinella persica]